MKHKDHLYNFSENKTEKPTVTLAKKVERNEQCPCGSGRKFKKCCSFIESTGASTLSRDERLAFFSLWYPLLEFVNRNLRLGLDINRKGRLPEIEIVSVLRERLWENPDLINQFINDSGGDFEITAEGIQVLKSWKNRHIKDTFLVVKFKPEYAVLMPIESEKYPVFYGVVGLESSIVEVLNYKVHTMIDAILLPYEGKIIYDGLVVPYPLTIDSGIINRISSIYREAEKEQRIITKM